MSEHEATEWLAPEGVNGAMRPVGDASPADRVAAAELLGYDPVREGDPQTAFCVICDKQVEMLQPERVSVENNRWKGYCDKGHMLFCVA